MFLILLPENLEPRARSRKFRGCGIGEINIIKPLLSTVSVEDFIKISEEN